MTFVEAHPVEAVTLTAKPKHGVQREDFVPVNDTVCIASVDASRLRPGTILADIAALLTVGMTTEDALGAVKAAGSRFRVQATPKGMSEVLGILRARGAITLDEAEVRAEQKPARKIRSAKAKKATAAEAPIA
jgi:hypothetical protein